jgi:hypothetical protein
MRTEDDDGEITNESANMNASNDGVVRYERPTVDYHPLDEEILGRMKRNDPSIVGLIIGENVDLIEGFDRVIGECTVLRHLKIELRQRSPNDRQWLWYQELVRGLSRNRSIESLELRVVNSDACADIAHDTLQILAPFFEYNNNLRDIDLYGCTPIFKSFASMMSQSNMNCQVQKACLVHIRDPTEDEEQAKLIKSLNHMPNLSELHLGSRRLRMPGCIELANLLTNSSSKIQYLDMEQEIANECAAILSNALMTNNKLIELSLSLNHEFTTASWRSVFKVFSQPTCTLKRLTLHSNHFEDEELICLGVVLAVNRTLKYLDLGFNTFITTRGWQGFAKCLRNRDWALEELDLSMCCMEDDGAAAIVNALMGNSSLKKLNLDDIPQITSAGWKFIFIVLLNNVPTLEDLVITIEQDDPDYIDWMTNMDWTIISRALCDDSSINATHTSNHSFHTFRGTEGEMIDELLPEEILSLLQMNRNEKNKTKVARQKILKYHFAEGNTNIHTFSRMPLTSMPFAFEWIGRGKCELSLMFSVVRELPTLFHIMLDQGQHAKKQRCWSS